MPNMPKTDKQVIAHGTVFDTHSESHCIALDIPDNTGNFDGIDPNGDITTFHITQVEFVYSSQYPLIRL